MLGHAGCTLGTLPKWCILVHSGRWTALAVARREVVAGRKMSRQALTGELIGLTRTVLRQHSRIGFWRAPFPWAQQRGCRSDKIRMIGVNAGNMRITFVLPHAGSAGGIRVAAIY